MCGRNSALATRIGDTPVGPEHDIFHGVAKYRRSVAVSFAYHYVHLQSDFEVFVISAQVKLRDVRDDGRLLM